MVAVECAVDPSVLYDQASAVLMFTMLYCPVVAVTPSFVTLSFQQAPKKLLCHLC